MSISRRAFLGLLCVSGGIGRLAGQIWRPVFGRSPLSRGAGAIKRPERAGSTPASHPISTEERMRRLEICCQDPDKWARLTTGQMRYKEWSSL